MTSLIGRVKGEEMGDQLCSWLATLSACQSSAEALRGEDLGEDLGTVLLLLSVCRSDIDALLERLHEGDPLGDDESQELIAHLYGEIATLKTRLLRAKSRRKVATARSRVMRFGE